MAFLISLILAVGVYFVLKLLLNIALLLTIPSAIFAFIFFMIIITKLKKRSEMTIEIETGLSPYKVNEIVREGHRKVSGLRSTVNTIRDREVRSKGLQICKLADQIFKDFKKDPSDIKTARKFTNYYLDTTINIITKYKELQSANLQSEEVEKTLKKSEEVLDTIITAFEKELVKLLENDVMNLDTEIELLEKTIKMENLGR